MSDIISRVGVLAVNELKKQIRKDADNRYSLKEEWRIPVNYLFNESEFEFFRFENRVDDTGNLVGSWIVVKPYESTAERNICDGATLSPDKFKGIIPATVFHDPWDLTIPQMVKAWSGDFIVAHPGSVLKMDGILSTEKSVRKIGDMIFENIVRAEGGKPWVARAYYNGIRYGYPCFRILKPILERL